MAIRILVPMQALPGKGPELARLRAARHAEVRKDAGCIQFDLYQNIEDPDQLLLVELWKDQASLDAHYALQRPQVGTELRTGTGKAERHITED
jgi:quinol monooxygenase YgiN